MLQIDDLEVRYADAIALHGVSLTVHAGELVTLLGANGAGKTTTLRAVAGLRPATRGTITFEGTPLLTVAPHHRAALGIALVPEGRELWPRLTVRENLELGAYDKRARAGRRTQLDRIHDLFPILNERARQPAGSMSGGEQQMVAIGRALMSRPRLLMLDEPSLGLAPRVVDQMFAAIRRLHTDGLTVLLVEQNLTRALEIADRGYVVETGRITLSGPSQDLLANPAVRTAYLGL